MKSSRVVSTPSAAYRDGDLQIPIPSALCCNIRLNDFRGALPSGQDISLKAQERICLVKALFSHPCSVINNSWRQRQYRAT